QKWRQLSSVLCDKHIPLRLKSKVYKTIVRPVILYGAECRPATKKSEQLLHCTEMRMLRWSLGITLYDHTPKSRSDGQWLSEQLQRRPRNPGSDGLATSTATNRTLLRN